MLIRAKARFKIQSFNINVHLNHEFGDGTYLESRESKGWSGALDCLSITSVSLLGRMLIRAETRSMIHDPRSLDRPGPRKPKQKLKIENIEKNIPTPPTTHPLFTFYLLL